MKWFELDTKMSTAHGLLTDYRIQTFGDGYKVEADAHFSSDPIWDPPVSMNFTNLAEARDFVEKFEVAMLRQAAQGYYVGPTSDGKNEGGIYARLNGDTPVLVYHEKPRNERTSFTSGPHVQNEEAIVKEVVLDVSKIWYGKTLRGMLLPDGTHLLSGNRATFNFRALCASHAALDVQALSGKLTLAAAKDILSRGKRRNESKVTISYKLEDTTTGETGIRVSSLETGLSLLLHNKGEDLLVSVVTANNDLAKAGRPSLTIVQTEPLTKERLIEILKDVSALKSNSNYVNDFESHVGLIAHIFENDLATACDPQSKLRLLPDARRPDNRVVRADWRLVS